MDFCSFTRKSFASATKNDCIMARNVFLAGFQYVKE